jgi:hypothetical protein
MCTKENAGVTLRFLAKIAPCGIAPTAQEGLFVMLLAPAITERGIAYAPTVSSLPLFKQ